MRTGWGSCVPGGDREYRAGIARAGRGSWLPGGIVRTGGSPGMASASQRTPDGRREGVGHVGRGPRRRGPYPEAGATTTTAYWVWSRSRIVPDFGTNLDGDRLPGPTRRALSRFPGRTSTVISGESPQSSLVPPTPPSIAHLRLVLQRLPARRTSPPERGGAMVDGAVQGPCAALKCAALNCTAVGCAEKACAANGRTSKPWDRRPARVACPGGVLGGWRRPAWPDVRLIRPTRWISRLPIRSRGTHSTRLRRPSAATVRGDRPR